MKKKTVIEIEKYFKEHDCILLEKEYKNNSTLMRYKCSCGNISKINLNNFKTGHRCMECGSKKTALNHRLKYKEIKKYFKDQNCILLTKKYINNHTKMKYMCLCGKNSEITFKDFKNEHRCMKCGSKKRSGKGNGKYNPNKTDEERLKERIYSEYTFWRSSVYERDDYTCKICNKRCCEINAHHIKNYYKYKELRTDLYNGITLCKECHNKFHKTYGKFENNQQQLDEFLKIQGRF